MVLNWPVFSQESMTFISVKWLVFEAIRHLDIHSKRRRWVAIQMSASSIELFICSFARSFSLLLSWIRVIAVLLKVKFPWWMTNLTLRRANTSPIRGVKWSLKKYGSRQILHESRNLSVTNKSLRISGSQKITLNSETRILQIEFRKLAFGRVRGHASQKNFENPGTQKCHHAFWVTFKLPHFKRKI